VDWSEGKWYPKVYRAVDTSFELLKSISVSPFLCSIAFV
jgi:hypothetical protein